MGSLGLYDTHGHMRRLGAVSHLCGVEDALALAESAGHVHLALVGDDGAPEARLVHRAHVLPLVRRREVPEGQLENYA